MINEISPFSKVVIFRTVLGPMKTRDSVILFSSIATGFSDRIVTLELILRFRLPMPPQVLGIRGRSLGLEFLKETVPGGTRIHFNWGRRCDFFYRFVKNAHIKTEITLAQRPHEGLARVDRPVFGWFLVFSAVTPSAHAPGQADFLANGWISETNKFARTRCVRAKTHVPARMGGRLEGKVEVWWLFRIVLLMMLGGDGSLIKCAKVAHAIGFSPSLKETKNWLKIDKIQCYLTVLAHPNIRTESPLNYAQRKSLKG